MGEEQKAYKRITTYRYPSNDDAFVEKLLDDLHALMWHSGDGCEICKFKIVEQKKSYTRLGCSLKGECDPLYENLEFVERHKEEVDWK